jgi:hypothetical protein
MNKNQDLPDHMFEHYLLPFPCWGSACHPLGEAKLAQGMEKTWDYLKQNKNYHQSRNNTKDLELILEAISQHEDWHPEELFSFKPTITKDDWSVLSHHHATEAGINFKSSVYYSLMDGKPLLHQQTVGKAEQTEVTSYSYPPMLLSMNANEKQSKCYWEWTSSQQARCSLKYFCKGSW